MEETSDTRRKLAACLLVAALLLLLESGGDPVREAMRLETTGVASWQLWRLVTGHLVHLGWPHTLINLTAFVLIAIGFGREFSAGHWLAVAGLSAATIDAGLLLLGPAPEWYVGLSGVLHGLVVAGGAGLYSRGHRLAGFVIVGVIVAKIALESISGALPLSAELTGGPVVVEAHLWGALGGGAAALWLIKVRRAPV